MKRKTGRGEENLTSKKLRTIAEHRKAAKTAKHLTSKELRKLSKEHDPDQPSLALFLTLELIEWLFIIGALWLLYSFVSNLW